VNITFVGGGNMATALISGLLQQGYSASQIRVVEINAKARKKITQQFDVKVVTDLTAGVADSDVVMLSVKPQQLLALTLQLAPLLSNQLVISIVAGIRATDISRWLDGYKYIVRAMPNTPSLVRAGVTGLYGLPDVSAQARKDVELIMVAVGSIFWVNQEEMLHAVTAISGSGPAYVFYFIEAMQQAGVELGLQSDQARQLSLQTFYGAAKLAKQSGEDITDLRIRVMSKGGTTERAIQDMACNNVKDKIIHAIHAASERSLELSDEFSEK